jgi:hypothetical protein
MAKWARIHAGVIAEIVTADPATLFTAPIAALFEPVDDSAVYRAVWDDQAEEWVPPPPPDPMPEPGPPDIGQAKAARKVDLAGKRWQVETGGIVRNGAGIATDDRSKSLISGALQLVDDDPQKTIKFKATSGWVTMDAATVVFIGREVGDHVQACFAREMDLCAEIDACESIQEVEEVDITTGWPSNTEEPV